MSDYDTNVSKFLVRLLWNGHEGCARCYDYQRHITIKPDVPGVDFDEIDYIPEVVRIIRPPRLKWRDLNRAEVESCIRYLIGL